ncbi:hypothetical protein R7X80_03020 [Mesomycoplasma ovipneumoniae]|uniref:hypothetical protein n=1 Tax=Mesomycoplasma ovipneumoniae TaxID=29562 RepID=UPI0029644BBC|nr:hypothetical protein [Mesomycoplasma ovipneumoniae]MDW2930808.1 hypothetical protein [Mesomycoplasma ovipneumoniae]
MELDKKYWGIKKELSQLKQAELYPLILEYIPDFANLPIKESEKILIEYLVSNNKLDEIPKTKPKFSYTPRNDKYRDNLFSNEKNEQIVKQLSIQLVELSKTNPIIAEKIKNDATHFSGWVEKNSYLTMRNELKKTNDLDFRKAKPDWYFKNIQFVKLDKNNFWEPKKMSKSSEGLMYYFLTQDMNSIEYLYAQYARAGQFLQFTKVFNIAAKSYDNKLALMQDLNPHTEEIKTDSLKIKHKI